MLVMSVIPWGRGREAVISDCIVEADFYQNAVPGGNVPLLLLLLWMLPPIYKGKAGAAHRTGNLLEHLEAEL